MNEQEYEDVRVYLQAMIARLRSLLLDISHDAALREYDSQEIQQLYMDLRDYRQQLAVLEKEHKSVE